jgi:hypothetical protein
MAPRADRYPTDLAASVLLHPESPQDPARVDNVSTRGLLLTHLKKKLAPEQPLWIELPRTARPNGTIIGRVGFLGRVCWTENDRAGVAIEAMLPHHRARFVRLLGELQSRRG